MADTERLRPLRIVVFNNDSETLKTVAHWFEINGHRVTTSALAVMRRADLEEIGDFLTRHNPDVIVYDVAIPYAPNWNYLSVLRTAPESRVVGCQFACAERNHAVGNSNNGALGVTDGRDTNRHVARLLRVKALVRA